MNALSLGHPHTCCKHCYKSFPFRKAPPANTCCWQPCKAASSFVSPNLLQNNCTHDTDRDAAQDVLMLCTSGS